MAELPKAILHVLNGRRKGTDIQVLFNPAEYSLEKANQFQSNALPGLENPLVQFVSGDADTLTMELFFDTYTDGGRRNVTLLTQQIADLLEIDAELHAPPLVRFVWGGFRFDAIIERLTQKFTMFLDDGTPVRATLSVTFKQYKTVKDQLESMARRSSDRSKRRFVEEGDQLWRLASEEYEDPTRWRAIAEANDLDNPRLLEIGSAIRIPPLD